VIVLIWQVYRITQVDFLMKGLSLLGTPSTNGSGSDKQYSLILKERERRERGRIL
jgi:hypothetical protein